jgi:hypothetical protein
MILPAFDFIRKNSQWGVPVCAPRFTTSPIWSLCLNKMIAAARKSLKILQR